MKAFVVAAALAVFATPAFAVDYLVHDQDGHGDTKCEFSQAVEVNISGFDYSSGDRTFMCLAPKPPRVFHGGNGGGSGGLLTMIKEAKDAANTPDPVTPDPETPPASIPATPPSVPATPLFPATPVTPPSVPATPLFPATPTPQPDPEPGECQKVSDCPNEPDPKPDPAPGDCGNNGRPCNPNNPGNGNGKGNPPCPPQNKHCN